MENESLYWTIIGLWFQIDKNTDEAWNLVKKSAVAAIKGDIFSRQFPCGNSLTLTKAEIMALPLKDWPCPCGNSTHWFVRVSIKEGQDG